MCTNKERGCEWESELNNTDYDLESSDCCWFEDVKSSEKCCKIYYNDDF